MANALLLLCHTGSWDRLYQAVSAAASAASVGDTVTLVFYFSALEKLTLGRLDEVTLEPQDPAREARLRQRIDEIGTPALDTMLDAARRTGRVRLLACSASVALMGLAQDDVRRAVDEIVGWPTVLSLMAGARHVLYL
jgi:peroxiredoxin family protein